MPTTTTLLQFAVAAAVLAVSPGPSLVLLLAVGADRGRRAGVATALGLALGTSVWGVVAAAGLGTVLAAQPRLLSVVTAVGGCYLLWLAVRALRAAPPVRDAPPTGRGAFRDGAVVNLLNPSIAVFLGSVVPPFLDLGRGPVWVQVLALSAVLVAVSTVVNVGAGVLGATLGTRARRRVGGAGTRRATAAVYALLGVAAFVVALQR